MNRYFYSNQLFSLFNLFFLLFHFVLQSYFFINIGIVLGALINLTTWKLVFLTICSLKGSVEVLCVHVCSTANKQYLLLAVCAVSVSCVKTNIYTSTHLYFVGNSIRLTQKSSMISGLCMTAVVCVSCGTLVSLWKFQTRWSKAALGRNMRFNSGQTTQTGLHSLLTSWQGNK